MSKTLLQSREFLFVAWRSVVGSCRGEIRKNYCSNSFFCHCDSFSFHGIFFFCQVGKKAGQLFREEKLARRMKSGTVRYQNR